MIRFHNGNVENMALGFLFQLNIWAKFYDFYLVQSHQRQFIKMTALNIIFPLFFLNLQEQIPLSLGNYFILNENSNSSFFSSGTGDSTRTQFQENKHLFFVSWLLMCFLSQVQEQENQQIFIGGFGQTKK